jgi:general secretion pathway protein H
VERQPTLRAAHADGRRPGVRRDPYAACSRFGTVADAFCRHRSRGLWVPAYAGTTGERGFALIEMLCVLAIIGLLAAIILPAIPRATSRAKLESYAVETAALLKADRTAALRRQIQVTTQVDAETRSIRSGVTGRVIRFPADVAIDAYLASRCADRNAGRSIDFFPSGMSCGGTIALVRPGMGYEVRVNWLTGGVEIVPKKLL